jgi:predicted HTH transcriptional regulator
MNSIELTRLLSLGEGQSVEFKTRADAKAAGQQVCAFLNSGGGYVVIGIDGDNEPVGVTDGHDHEALYKLELPGAGPQGFGVV